MISWYQESCSRGDIELVGYLGQVAVVRLWWDSDELEDVPSERNPVWHVWFKFEWELENDTFKSLAEAKEAARDGLLNFFRYCGAHMEKRPHHFDIETKP